jgi:dipeptidase D
MLSLPHGVQKMDAMVRGLVETSVNFATAGLSGDRLEMVLSVRSSIESARDALIGRVAAVARLAGLDHYCSDGYPGWSPDHGSALLSLCRRVFGEVSGEEAEVEIIHAGLECGLIGSRIQGMDMISAGPDIHDVHVPGESVSISSLARFWKFLTVLLESLE